MVAKKTELGDYQIINPTCLTLHSYHRASEVVVIKRCSIAAVSLAGYVIRNLSSKSDYHMTLRGGGGVEVVLQWSTAAAVPRP